MKNQNLNKLIKISLLSVMGFLLQFFVEIPIPIFPSFLKLDISDVPALFGGFALGPISGVLIEFMKNLLKGIFKPNTMWIGEIANFCIGSILIVISTYIYKIKKTKTNALIGLMLGTIVMSIAAAVFNYYVLIPAYSKAFGAPIEAFVGMASEFNSNVIDLKTLIIWTIIPFNLLKGLIISIVTMILYKSVSPILHKEQLAIERNKMMSKKSTM
jgi:riboflavin transporter FmnP